MKLTSHRTSKKARIELIPMIDTIFFLLVFYILSSLALSHQESIPVNLPKAATGEETERMEIIVTITKEGKYFLNATPVPEQNIGDALRKEILETQGEKALPKTTVILNADLAVPHRQVVLVMDQARAAGISHFAIATTPKGDPQKLRP